MKKEAVAPESLPLPPGVGGNATPPPPPSPVAVARKDIDAYFNSFRGVFKDGSAFFTGKGGSNIQAIDVIPSRIPSLDAVLGCGGIPRGRVVELYGPESSGKTTLAMHFAIEAQRLGGIVHVIDAEHALDILYYQKLGYDPSQGLVSQPDNGEQGLEMVDFAIRSGVDVVVVDSVAALTPKAEIEGDMGQAHMGLQARLMSQALRKITMVKDSRTTVIFINQLRMKLGVMFGNPETTPGGNALKFYASVRMDIRKGESIKDGEAGEPYGHKLRIKTVKNKCAMPFRTTEVRLIYGKGFDRAGDIMDLGVERGIIEKTGSWYAFEGDRLGNGQEVARKFLVERPEVLERIAAKVLATPA